MRVLAIILSPLLVVVLAWIFYNIFSQHTELWFLLLQIILTYFVTLFVQLIVEIILYILKLWFTVNFKIYLKIACIICLSSAVIVFLITYSANNDYMKSFTLTLGIFVFLIIYSIGNVITYNYLYFSKLKK